MKRWFGPLNLAAVVSMVLCIATVALWVRSYDRLDSVQYVFNSQGAGVSIQSVRGRVSADYRSPFPTFADGHSTGLSYDSVNAKYYRALTENPELYGRSYALKSFGILVPAGRRLPFYRAIWFPHWFLAGLFAVMPALRVRTAIRSRRVRVKGCCLRCGYDLRATPERCPECGMIPGETAQADLMLRQRSANE